MTEHAPLQHLPDHPDASDPEPFAGPDHPMRKVTRAVAFEGEWEGVTARAGTGFWLVAHQT